MKLIVLLYLEEDEACVDDLLGKHRDLWKFYVLVAPSRADARSRLAAACASGSSLARRASPPTCW